MTPAAWCCSPMQPLHAVPAINELDRGRQGHCPAKLTELTCTVMSPGPGPSSQWVRIMG